MGTFVYIQSLGRFQAFWNSTRSIESRSNDPIVLDPNIQKLDCQFPHFIKRVSRDFVRWQLRMDSEQKQNLGAINIANSCNDRLIEQQAADGGATFFCIFCQTESAEASSRRGSSPNRNLSSSNLRLSINSQQFGPLRSKERSTPIIRTRTAPLGSGGGFLCRRNFP